jgi:F-type H+-transporting ATPase subunit delta
MAKGSAARRYAKALFSLAQEENRAAQVREEVERLGRQLAESAELRAVLLRPLHPVAQRRAVLAAAVSERLGASSLLRRFLSFLIDQRRLVDYETIEAEYGRLADAAAGVTKAHVRSAAPLSDAQRERLQRALQQQVGGRVEIALEIDPSLVAGAVAQVGDLVYDGSLRTQLRQLRASLARG